jgi:hypothetical protein
MGFRDRVIAEFLNNFVNLRNIASGSTPILMDSGRTEDAAASLER